MYQKIFYRNALCAENFLVQNIEQKVQLQIPFLLKQKVVFISTKSSKYYPLEVSTLLILTGIHDCMEVIAVFMQMKIKICAGILKLPFGCHLNQWYQELQWFLKRKGLFGFWIWLILLFLRILRNTIVLWQGIRTIHRWSIFQVIIMWLYKHLLTKYW